MTSADPAFDGAILCGGESRRMGSDKAFVEVDGAPMVARVADALAEAGAARVHGVGGDLAALAEIGLVAIADRWPGEGPLGGLVTALGAVGGAEVVAVLSCDLIHPDPTEIRMLAGRLCASDADAVVPRVDDRAQWMHGVWRRRVVGVLEDVYESGERSLYGAVTGIEVDFVAARHRRAYADADSPYDLPGTA